MDKNAAVTHLNTLIEEGKEVLNTSYSLDGVYGGPWVKSELYSPWKTKAAMVLHEVLPEHQQTLLRKLEKRDTNHTSTAKDWQGQLQGALEAIKSDFIKLDETIEDGVDEVIESILNRFPDVATSINLRHADRNGFAINDEYDVQDLLKFIFLVHFNDVRLEEVVPSFAGKSSRIDIFLKEEARFIEVKMTRDGLRDKKLGEELTIDIAQYKEHPGCERLFCFIYDKDRFIRNPTGLKRDLEKINPGFVTVIIAR